MEILSKIQAQLEIAMENGEKFYTKGNASAGTRLRKALQEIKNLAQEARKDVQNTKNESKSE